LEEGFKELVPEGSGTDHDELVGGILFTDVFDFSDDVSVQFSENSNDVVLLEEGFGFEVHQPRQLALELLQRWVVVQGL
jgi:hypothetical protein